MLNIRQSVFETNSSSTHSISIAASSDGILETLPVDESGCINLIAQPFGWEFEKYNDALTKAIYAALFAKGNLEMSEMLFDVIKEHTGAKKVNLIVSNDYSHPDYGYIDHQSSLDEGGDAKKAFESAAALKNWIFNSSSYLFTGNDNSDPPPNFFDDANIKYNYELVIDGFSQTAKLTDILDVSSIAFKDTARSIILTEKDLREGNEDEDYYQFVGRENKTYKGKTYSSLSKLDSGVIVLYVLEDHFIKNKYCGYKVLKTREHKFQFKKI